MTTRLLIMIPMAALIVAGCSDGGESLVEPLGDDGLATPSVVFTAETGGIVGLVIDDAFNPIPGANVTLNDIRSPDALADTRTSVGGRFVFSNLPPDTYILKASQDGFGTGTVLLQVKAGQATEVTVTLDDVPGNEPYVDYYTQRGILRCAISYVAFADTCTIGVVMGSNQNEMDFNISVGHRWIVVETDWNERTATMDHDFFTRDAGDAPRGTIVGRGYGTPILRTDFWPEKEYQATPIADKNIFPPSDQEFVFRIATYYDGQYQNETNTLGGPACDYMLLGYCTGAGIALDFTFTEYVSVFIRAVPEDIEAFTAVADR